MPKIPMAASAGLGQWHFFPATSCRTTLTKGTPLNSNETISEELRVSVYHNPSSNVFNLTVHTAKTEVVQLRVIDINGK